MGLDLVANIISNISEGNMENRRNAANCRYCDTHDSEARMLKRHTSAGSAAVFNWWRIVAIALIVWAACGVLEPRLAAAQDVPSATIDFSGGSVAAGIGYTWGGGTLLFDGKEYSLKVDGLTIVHVGISGYTASGAVYHLTKLTDIQGVYTAVSAGVAVAGGATATAMKNNHGVVIEMTATHTGLNFQLGPQGVTIKLISHIGLNPNH